MGAILEINRDFPFEVALSFEEAAMEVLDWLEGSSFEWDMYVDLPGRYGAVLLSHRRGRLGVQAAFR